MTAIEQLEESVKQDREGTKVEEQQIEILITEDVYPLLFHEFRDMAKEGVQKYPDDVGNDVILKKAETAFEKSLLNIGVTFKLKFADGFSCKVVLV